jgi:predicted dehydrogenase
MRPELYIGILGCGHLTQKGVLRHLLCDDFRRYAEVVALCDVAGERAQSVARQYGIPQHYTDLEAMLAHAKVDAVLVLTPVQHHYANTMACLRAGKHVYVQKTMAMTFAQASEMVSTAQAKGLTLASAPGQMLCPAYQQMKQCIEADGIGRVMWCYAGTTTGNAMETIGGDGIDTTWQYQHGGGALWNTTVYSFHALTGILGPVRKVSATMNTVFPERKRGGVPFTATEVDNALLTLEFNAGPLAFCWGCRSATGKILDWGAIGFYGTGGSLECTKVHMESGWPEIVEWRGRGKAQTLHYPRGGFVTGEGWETPLAPARHADILEQHVYLDILDFAIAVREERPPIADALHAAHVVEVIEKAYVAAQTGQSQEIRSAF